MKLYRLEALRGLAAFYVLLHHTIPAKSVNFAGQNFGFLFRFGQEAVILFFILSGFVIHYSFTISKDKSFKNYFFKRALRIYTPLVIVFIASYVLASYNNNHWIDPDLKTLFLNLVMLQDWEVVKPNVIASAYMNNTPLWSLSYEWWFYMLYFPLIKLKTSHSNRHKIVFGIAALAALIYIFYPIFPMRVLMYIGIWWSGVYLAELYLSSRTYNINTCALPLLALTLICGILLFFVISHKLEGNPLLLGHHPLLELRHFLFATIALVLALIWKSLKWIGFDVLIKPFEILAPVSYAMYISHLPLMAKAQYLDFISHDLVRWVAYFLVVLIFSWAVEVSIYRRIKSIMLRTR